MNERTPLEVTPNKLMTHLLQICHSQINIKLYLQNIADEYKNRLGEYFLIVIGVFNITALLIFQGKPPSFSLSWLRITTRDNGNLAEQCSIKPR